MIGVAYVYVSVKGHAGGVEWPAFDTPAGPALAAFTGAESAERFRLARGFGPEWRAGGMARAEFLRWLRHNLGSGTRLLALDPEPDAHQHFVLPIDRLLEEAER
jgi:hypothetical protein